MGAVITHKIDKCGVGTVIPYIVKMNIADISPDCIGCPHTKSFNDQFNCLTQFLFIHRGVSDCNAIQNRIFNGNVFKTNIFHESPVSILNINGNPCEMGNLAMGERNIPHCIYNSLQAEFNGPSPIIPKHAIVNFNIFNDIMFFIIGSIESLNCNIIIKGPDKGIFYGYIPAVHNVNSIGIISPQPDQFDIINCHTVTDDREGQSIYADHGE